MGLAASPGSENPSAAFLAGQQHGAALATQHHTAPPAKAPPAKQQIRTGTPAAPRKPASSTQTAPGGFDLAGLLAQAQQLAQAQTAAQVKAIQAQQDVYTKQGQERAAQIGQASKAAADYLSGLGNQTAASYTDAAKSLGSLAQGFSGQTGTDAANAAAQIQANLASLGAPAGTGQTATGQTSSPTGLANVLYGLGGYIPGNLLLTSGEGAAAAARALPAGVLGSGQQQAAGALSAGQDRADTLTPQILDAQGKQPGLAQSIYGSLLDGIYKQAALAATQARLDQGQTRLDQGQQSLNLRARMDAFNQTYKINAQKISVARLNLSAKQFAQQTIQSDRSYGIALAGLGLRQQSAQRAAIAQEYKLQNGGFTPVQINKFKTSAFNVAQNAFNGIPADVSKTGKAVPSVDYKTAIREMRSAGVPLSLAIPELNKLYKPGQRGRPGGNSGVSWDFTGTAPFDRTANIGAQSPLPGSTGKVTVAPSADRAGVNLSPIVTSFVSKIAGVAGTPLTITTGTNHNQFVAGSDRVSDHWSGHAADIAYGHGSPGRPDPALTRLGQEALIAAGMPVAQAVKQTGGLFNLDTPYGRVQIIFNSLTGGNHFNHLHVGVR